MHNPTFVLEIETHKLLWDFEIQSDHLILAWRPDFKIINKNMWTCRIVDFAVPVDRRLNLKEREKKDKYLDLAGELKRLWNMKVMVILIVISALGTVTKGLVQGLEDLEKTGQDHPNYCIIEILQNTEKSPGHLKRLAVPQTPVKDHQQTLIWKTLKGWW